MRKDKVTFFKYGMSPIIYLSHFSLCFCNSLLLYIILPHLRHVNPTPSCWFSCTSNWGLKRKPWPPVQDKNLIYLLHFSLCFWKSFWLYNVFPHFRHWNPIPSCWFSCTSNWALRWKPWLHVPQWKGNIPVCSDWCIFIPLPDRNDFPHPIYWQQYPFPSCFIMWSL